jgi:CHAT domain-containing protein
MHSDRAISADVPALLVGSAASSADAGLFVIPNVAAGVEETARRFHSARVLNSPEATFSAVASALPAAAVFHFAGHAATNSNHSGLMLDGNDESNGGAVLLDASGVRRLDLRKLELAVLAACSTDSGDGGSRGLDSVADAFQSAGVPHVVASRWAVDSVQTSAFTDDFYHSLLLGQPVAAATREASQRMLSTPGTAHPFYWAALAAYGRP